MRLIGRQVRPEPFLHLLGDCKRIATVKHVGLLIGLHVGHNFDSEQQSIRQDYTLRTDSMSKERKQMGDIGYVLARGAL